MTSSQPRRWTAALLLVALAPIACAGGGEQRGGESSLPGPVPAGVSFPREDPSSPPAPEFSLTLMDGSPVRGYELWRERPVVLFFFASWCSRCIDQQVELNSVVKRMGDSVVILAIAGEDEETDVDAFLIDHEVPHAVAMDDDLMTWRSYGVREPPHVVVIAKGGRVTRGWPGVTKADAVIDTLRT